MSRDRICLDVQMFEFICPECSVGPKFGVTQRTEAGAPGSAAGECTQGKYFSGFTGFLLMTVCQVVWGPFDCTRDDDTIMQVNK